MEKLKIGKYKHFKGGIYIVTAIAKYSEDPEKEFGIYCHDGAPNELWVRPVEMFSEHVERDDYNGPRFEYIGE